MRKKSFVTAVVLTSINFVATILAVIYYLGLPFDDGLEALALIVLLPLLFIFMFFILVLWILSLIFNIRAIKSESKKIKITSIIFLCLNILVFLGLAFIVGALVLRITSQ